MMKVDAAKRGTGSADPHRGAQQLAWGDGV